MATHPHFWRRLRRLGYVSYQDYLRSPHWRRLRAAYRASCLRQDCYCCGEAENTDLHHKTYERMGEERFADLIPLCERCHSLVHVLESRGDLGIDLTGLLDEARAARYKVEQPFTPAHVARERDDAERRGRASQARIANRTAYRAARRTLRTPSHPQEPS